MSETSAGKPAGRCEKCDDYALVVLDGHQWLCWGHYVEAMAARRLEGMDDFTAAYEMMQVEADRRNNSHADHTTERFGNNSNFVGMIGEAEFARQSGCAFDFSRKIKGDGGIDFIVPMRFTVDVKTTRNPIFLFGKQGKITADIYVLASYSDTDHSVEMLGWEFGSVLVRAPTRDFGYGVVNHYIPRGELRPMPELLERIMKLR